MSEETKHTMSQAFNKMREGVKSAKGYIANPENQEKVRKGFNIALAGVCGILNTVAYSATTAVVGVKNGIVDGLADADRDSRR
jgi:hypothetical protein